MVGAQRRCAGKEGGGIRLMVALRGEQRGNGRYAEWRVLIGVRRPLVPTGVHGDGHGAPIRHTLLQQQIGSGVASPCPYIGRYLGRGTASPLLTRSTFESRSCAMIEHNGPSERSPFLIITPNPAIDRILVVPALQIGKAQRVQESRIAAGGKGLNAGRAMKALGVTASILAPLGGFTGQQVTHLARREGLALSDVPIGDETRVCTLVVDLTTQHVTVLNEIGPQLTDAEWAAFRQAILDHPATWHLFCGSFPPGIEPSTLATLIRALRVQGKRVLIDTSGATLAMAITAQPDVVKVNGEELGGLLGDPINDEHTACQAAIRLHREGIGQVIVTLGADGAIGVNRTTVVKATPPAVPVQNPVGCGDSFFAGLAIALERGQPLATALRLATACGAADAQTLAPGHIDDATVNALAERVHLRYW